MIFRKGRFTERDIQVAKMYKETLKFTMNRDIQIKTSILPGWCCSVLRALTHALKVSGLMPIGLWFASGQGMCGRQPPGTRL